MPRTFRSKSLGPLGISALGWGCDCYNCKLGLWSYLGEVKLLKVCSTIHVGCAVCSIAVL